MKHLLLLLLLCVSSASFAQMPQPSASKAETTTTRPMMSPEDRAAHAEGRIAAFKATLKLTPEQEKLWPAVETAMREDMKAKLARAQSHQDMREKRAQMSPIERLKMQSVMMIESGTRAKTLAETLAPLYNTLDEGQKRRFAQLFSWESRMGGERPNFRERMREERNAPSSTK